MCGIAGMFGKGSDPQKVSKMVEAMRRRGPDDEGVWADELCGLVLGHARLSIIDLSAAGHQPMVFPSQGAVEWVIVFNGEIYNYKELRKELEALGAMFRTHCDTEVILWGWKIWGKETPGRLRGMFAFAIWDVEHRILTLVRDRMGIKPLLWYRGGGGMIFGSSLRALLASGDVPRTLNEVGLADYLLQGAVLQPRTMIKDVQSLESGTLKEFRFEGAAEIREGASERYWTLGRNEELSRELAGLSYEEQCKVVRQKLEEACRYHLVADVPVGSFLSGGVDSTAITALMAQLSDKKIRSFSIGFSRETGMQDELREACFAARHIGTDHTEVCLTGQDVATHFDDFITTLDQPSVDGLNTYWVSKVTHDHGIKVALSGLGGDELFGGYDHFRWTYDNERAHAGFPRVAIDWLWLLLYRQLSYSRHPFEQCRYLVPLHESLASLRRSMTEQQARQALIPAKANAVGARHMVDYAAALCCKVCDPMSQITHYECKNYLQNTLLRDADALSMGHGVEARPIFLDHILVEHTLSLPAESKWRAGVPKAILKDATMDLLPPDFFERRKTGFTLPTHYWVEHELAARYRDAIQNAARLDGFNREFLRALEVNRTSKHVRRIMWQMLVLLTWMDAEHVS